MDVDLGWNKRPLIRSWFLKGMKATKTELAVFINADILVEDDFNRKIQKVHKNAKRLRRYSKKVFYVADRYDTRWKKKLDYDITPKQYKDYIQVPSYTRIDGCDLFIFNPRHPPFDFTTMKDFVVGLPRWDDCLLAWGLNSKFTIVVALDPLIDLFHLNHVRKRIMNMELYKMLRKTDYWANSSHCWDSDLMKVYQSRFKPRPDGSLYIIDHNYKSHSW